MARRASSHLHPGIIIGAVAAIVVAVVAGKSFIGKKSNTFGDVARLSVGDLLDNGNSLRGIVWRATPWNQHSPSPRPGDLQ